MLNYSVSVLISKLLMRLPFGRPRPINISWLHLPIATYRPPIWPIVWLGWGTKPDLYPLRKLAFLCIDETSFSDNSCSTALVKFSYVNAIESPTSAYSELVLWFPLSTHGWNIQNIDRREDVVPEQLIVQIPRCTCRLRQLVGVQRVVHTHCLRWYLSLQQPNLKVFPCKFPLVVQQRLEEVNCGKP